MLLFDECVQVCKSRDIKLRKSGRLAVKEPLPSTRQYLDTEMLTLYLRAVGSATQSSELAGLSLRPHWCPKEFRLFNHVCFPRCVSAFKQFMLGPFSITHSIHSFMHLTKYQVYYCYYLFFIVIAPK